MPLQCPTLNGIGITHIIIPFGINPLKIAVFRAVRLYMSLSLFRIPKQENKQGFVSTYCEYQKDLNFVTVSFFRNTATLYKIQKNA